MRLHDGKTVIVKTYETRPSVWNQEGLMDKYMGKIVTIKHASRVRIWEDGGKWMWRSGDFEEVYLLPEDLFEI